MRCEVMRAIIEGAIGDAISIGSPE